MNVSLRFALREMRGGPRGARLLALSAFMGAAAAACVGSLTETISIAFVSEGSALLGGDIEARHRARDASTEEKRLLAENGKVSRIESLRAMADGGRGRRSLVEIKAIDPAYPLYGDLRITTLGKTNPDAPNLAAMLAPDRNQVRGAAVDETLLARLGLDSPELLKRLDRRRQGSPQNPDENPIVVNVGTEQFEIRAILESEPDRVSGGMFLGPRMMVDQDALKAADLLREGSLVERRYRIRLRDNPSPQEIENRKQILKDALAPEGWRLRSRRNAAPGVKRVFDDLADFMTLAALVAMLAAGIGVANACAAYLAAKRTSIAVLKSLGAARGVVFRCCLWQVLMLAAIGVALGTALGALAPAAAAIAFNHALPAPLNPGIRYVPLAAAAVGGMLVAIAFSLPVAARAANLFPATLFRGDVAEEQTEISERQSIAPALGAVTALIAFYALAVIAFGKPAMTALAFAGFGTACLLLDAAGSAVVKLAEKIPRPKHVVLRMAIANLHRPNAPTRAVLVSLGAGLSLFVAVALIDENLSRMLRSGLPKNAPAFFFLDVLPDDAEKFAQRLRQTNGVNDVGNVPMLRGRILNVNGKPAENITPHPSVAWALRGDRGITYAEKLPPNSQLVNGKWWEKNYNGPPLVSMVDEIADGIGLAVGDSIAVRVLGREINATLANTRSVEWRSLGINFVLVLSPNALKGAPHTNLMTANVTGRDAERKIIELAANEFPSVTSVRVRDALEVVAALLERILFAVRGVSSITLAVGALVLAGAMRSTLQARIYDAAVLKTLGASRALLARAYLIEYAALGALAAVFALAAGSVAAKGIIELVMDLEWQFALKPAVNAILLSAALAAAIGFAATWKALAVSAARALRRD